MLEMRRASAADLARSAASGASSSLPTNSRNRPIFPERAVTPLDMIFGHTPSLAQGHLFMAHKTGFTRRSLQMLLDEAGFVEVQVRRGDCFRPLGNGPQARRVDKL